MMSMSAKSCHSTGLLNVGDGGHWPGGWLVGGADVGGDEVGGADVGGADVGGPVVGLVDPLQTVPLSEKLVGTALSPPLIEALNPKFALPFAGMLPFQLALVTVTSAPDWA